MKRSAAPRGASSGSRRQRARGLTLVELLVTMVISLVVLGAVSYTYLGSRGAYRTNDSLARIQETGRFALDAMSRDLRRTGFVGCASSATAVAGVAPTVFSVSPGVPTIDYSPTGMGVVNAYAGANPWTPPAGATNYVPGTHVLKIRLATSAPLPLADNPDTVAGRISITVPANPQSCGLQPGAAATFLAVASCTRAALVQTTAAPACPAAGTTLTVNYVPGPAGYALGPPGAPGLTLAAFASVQQFDEVTYFVGTNANGGKSLFRYSLSSGAADEVVDSVEDMYLTFGVGDPATREVAKTYTPAQSMLASDWSNVVSVEVQLLIVGGDAKTSQGAVAVPQTYNFGGTATTATDTRLRDVFTTTVALRNRMS